MVEEVKLGTESLSWALETHLQAFERINSTPPHSTPAPTYTKHKHGLGEREPRFLPVARKNCFKVFLGYLADCQRGKAWNPLVK